VIENPLLLHHLLNKLAQAICLHLKAQITAGVQVVMLFDTWGGMLNTPQYQEFSLYYLQQIISELKNSQVPIILFTKGGGQWLDLIAASGCDVIGIDALTSLAQAKQQVGEKVALQGNMDPAILSHSPDDIRAEVARILQAFGFGSGHIFNLGHGITPDISPENVAVLVEAVHTLSQSYHKNRAG
jgi:uroporphyrinogen decarboxylase